MKLSFKIALVLLTVFLLSAVSVVYAQSITGANTVSPTSSNLNSVAIVSNTTAPTLVNSGAWAVGDGGTIISWNGTRWSTVTSNTTTNLNSIVMVDPNNGWAVGGGTNSGIILKYNGTWTVINATSAINQTLYAVTTDATGATGWAVGANGTVVYWNGAQWAIQTSPTTNTLRSVAMIHGANDVWAVGDSGTILHYNGNTWSNMTSSTTSTLNAIVMVNASAGWAAGGSTNNGVLLYMNGTSWSNWNRINFGGAVNSTLGYVTDKINATINSLSIDTANSAWAAGVSGTVLYWTGTEWDGQANIIGSANLRSIAIVHGAASGSSYAWAVGDGGKILAWTGTSWIPEFPLMTLPILLSMVALAAFICKSWRNKKLPY
jgi:hypothetical protein